jgi:hypothetical protein
MSQTPPCACFLPVINRRGERKFHGGATSRRSGSACLPTRPTQIYSTGCVQWTMRGGGRYSRERCEGSV